VIFAPVKEVATSDTYETRERPPAARQPSWEYQFRRKSIPVEAALTGNPRLVFQALCYDPLTAAVLSLAEIKAMVNEMLQQNRDHLPQFEHLKV
jgi:alpha-galactosidase/6-phospho-beta-glucosidase family protein